MRLQSTHHSLGALLLRCLFQFYLKALENQDSLLLNSHDSHSRIKSFDHFSHYTKETALSEPVYRYNTVHDSTRSNQKSSSRFLSS